MVSFALLGSGHYNKAAATAMQRYRWAQGGDRKAATGGKSRTELLLQYGLAPVLTALLGFLVGFGIEQSKATTRAEELLQAQRMKVWIATTEHSAAYLNNWSRLRAIAEYGQGKAGGLDAAEKERLKSYVSGRATALDLLSADLDQARLFFSDEVGGPIDEFLAFVTRYRTATLKELPPEEDYEKRRNAIVRAMRKEVLRQ